MIWRCWLRNRQWNCPCGRDRSKNATLRTTDGASRGEKVMPSSGISFPEMSRKTCLFLTLPFTMWYGRGELWAGVIRADNPKCLHQRETSLSLPIEPKFFLAHHRPICKLPNGCKRRLVEQPPIIIHCMQAITASVALQGNGLVFTRLVPYENKPAGS